MIHGLVRVSLFGVLFCGCTAWDASFGQAAQQDVNQLISGLSSDKVEDRIKAIDAVTRLGPNAPSKVVPALSKIMTMADPESRWRAARALAAIGPGASESVPSLIEGLKHSDPLVRAYSAHALGKMGDAAKEAVGELVKRAVDKNRLVRREAREALLAINAPPEITLPLVLKVLEEAEPAAVVPALETLAEHGKEVLPRLMAALKDDKACYWACLVIGRMGPEAKEAVSQLRHCITKERPEIRIEAVLALASIGKDSRVAQDQVIEMLNHDAYDGVKIAAAFALGRFGDEKAVPALEKATQGKDPVLKLTALWSLVQLKPTDEALMKRAVAAFAEGLQSENPTLRSVAATAFAETDIPAEISEAPLLNSLVEKIDQETIQRVMDAFVKRGKAVVPRVIRALDNPRRRPFALQILSRIGANASAAVPALIKLLDEADNAKIKRETILTLGAIGPAAAPALPKLLKLLKDADVETKYALTYAIGQLGPKAADANPQLLELVGSQDRFLRVSALWALLKVNPGDKEIGEYAVPHLINALSDSRPGVRAEMAGVLGELGPLAKDAIGALQKLANTDPDALVRDVATEALVKIQDPDSEKEHADK